MKITPASVYWNIETPIFLEWRIKVVEATIKRLLLEIVNAKGESWIKGLSNKD